METAGQVRRQRGLQMKSFKYDFATLLRKLKQRTPFAFSRFSDGQMFIMQNKHLTLGDGITRVGDHTTPSSFKPQDHKNFDPNQHGFYRERLMQAYRFKKPGYYKGLSCRCCVGETDFNWMIKEHGGDDQSLTWANLWVNGNYPLFIQKMVPQFKNYKVIMVRNKNANLQKMPFDVVNNFTCGYNAMINDYYLVNVMKRYIQQDDIKDHLFLFSASTLSNFLIHQLYKQCDKNTYIDIGTTLNYYMDMRLDRSYLQGYWNKIPTSDLNKVCIW